MVSLLGGSSAKIGYAILMSSGMWLTGNYYRAGYW